MTIITMAQQDMKSEEEAPSNGPECENYPKTLETVESFPQEMVRQISDP